MVSSDLGSEVAVFSSFASRVFGGRYAGSFSESRFSACLKKRPSRRSREQKDVSGFVLPVYAGV